MKSRIILVVVLILFFCGKKNSDVLSTFPPGNLSTTSSFNANLSVGDPFSMYESEYTTIRAFGSHGAQTAGPWSSLNPTGTTYDLTMINNPYFGLTKLASYGYETIFLNISIVSISARTMPADIASLNFDDAIVKGRYRALIDAVKDQLVSQVKYVSLGNEVDTYFSTHPGEWGAYKNLVEDAKSYLKSLKPNLIVGVTTTFDGATSTFTAEIQNLNVNMDAVMLTYYPISKSFQTRDPSTVSADVAKMVGISQGKQLIMQEWGYPSSSALGSSEMAQAQFLYNSFVELEKQGISKFPFVSFFKYRDWTTTYVKSMTGQQPGQPFYEFMNSLGLKKNDGSPKQAFTVVQSWIKP